MDPFPTEHELLGLLGEPVLTDPGISWAYNRLTFTAAVEDRSAEVVIEPGEGHVELRINANGSELASLSFSPVTGMEVESARGREVLVVTLAGREPGLVRLQVRPRLHLFVAVEPPR